MGFLLSSKSKPKKKTQSPLPRCQYFFCMIQNQARKFQWLCCFVDIYLLKKNMAGRISISLYYLFSKHFWLYKKKTIIHTMIHNKRREINDIFKASFFHPTYLPKPKQRVTVPTHHIVLKFWRQPLLYNLSIIRRNHLLNDYIFISVSKPNPNFIPQYISTVTIRLPLHIWEFLNSLPLSLSDFKIWIKNR